METKVTHVPPKKQYGRYAAILGAVLVAVGAFLPWGKVNDVITTGMDGDGIITLVGAILVLIALFIRKIPLWVSMIIGLVIVAIGIAQTFSISQKIDEIKSIFASSLIGPNINGRIDFGVYLTILGSTIIVFGTLIQWIKNRKK
ncbi:hypothetical protein HZA40_01075 [Candidatus Peregrinibacteria bacterium]|nr:hypothetical protein [Candidatus Peregrinibacteria bacterium]